MFLTDKFMSEADKKAETWSLTLKGKSDAELEQIALKHVCNRNKKLGTNCKVFNTGTAHNCPSIKLGYCQAGSDCYAQRDERQYKESYPYRARQAQLWKYITPSLFASALLKQRARCRITSNRMLSFRYSESGDFSSQAHVEWIAQVCKILSAHGIVCFGYTARADLDISTLAKYSQVNVSNDKFPTLNINRFKMVLELQADTETCLCSTNKLSSCADCRLCKVYTGTVQILRH